MLEKYLALFKAHERAIIIAVVLAFGAHGYGRWIDLQSANKTAQVDSLTQTVEQDKTTVASLASQAAQAQSTYQATLTAMQAQNAQLAQTIAQESAALSRTQAVDRSLPLPQLGQRLETLVPDAKGGVTATTNGLVLNDAASRATVSQLEAVPVLTDQLSKETQTAANDSTLLTGANAVNSDLTKEVGALRTQIGDQKKQCTAQISAVKADARKSKWRAFKAGFVIGFGVGAYIGHII